MRSLNTQLRQILRRLRRAPMFTAVTLFTLAAGIGANIVVFSVLESVLLKPLPYPRSGELVSVAHTAPGIHEQDVSASPSAYFTYREQSRIFQDIGILTGDSVNVTGQAAPEQLPAVDVTDGILPILGIRPVLGRWFSRQDDSPGSPATAMITYGYWQRKFGGDPGAIGRNIHVDGKAREIIGVMPRKSHFPGRGEVSLILPLQLDRSKTFLGNFSYQGIARLKPGATLAEANADVARMIPIMLRSFPPFPGFSLKLFEDARIGPNVQPLKDRVVGDVGNTLWVLMGSIGMVLLIACANVANLVLVRVEGRRQELAIRAALGARWSRIARELLFESLVLGLAGSALGLGLAYAALPVIVALAPSGLPRVHEIGIDGSVLLFTLFLALLASLLFGSIPIFKHAGRRLSTGLREGGRGLSQSREQHRARSVLVVVQVSLALVLLICSGLMLRTFVALTNVEPGFSRPAEIQTFSVSIPDTEVRDDERVVRAFDEMERKIAAVPGVVAVGLSAHIPMDGNSDDDPVFMEDRSYKPGELPPLRRFKYIGPGFLATMGTPLLAGRDFTWADVYNAQPVALVSASLAREYWQSPPAALGKRIRVGNTDDWREIVGVVADVYDDGVSQKPSSSVYWPIWTKNFEGQKSRVYRSLNFAIRTPRAGSASLRKELEKAVWSVDPNLPLADVHTAEYFYRRSMARTSFTLLLLAVAGGMALLLGTVGIYGVIAYSVSQRTREIGIRIALGAQRGALTGMFVRHAAWLTGIGIACGLVVSVLLSRVMVSLLFKVSPVDLVTYSAVSLALLATAALASYLPSRRAAAVNPVAALRSE